MRLFEDDAEFFSDAKTPASLPVLDDKNSNDIRTQSTIDEHNEGESLRRSEATGKGLSSSVEESPAQVSSSSLSGPSFLTKLLILLIPMLVFAGFYTYSQVKGAVFFNKTLDTSTSLESGLVGHWTFDGEDMTLTTALDSSGNGNTGTLTGLATSARVAGKIGQAIYFPDSLARYINAGSAAVLDNITQLTIAAWVYERSSGGGGTIIDKGGGAAGGWNLWIFDGTLRFDRDFSGTDGIWETDTPISTDTWHYIVVTYDKSSTGNAPIIYVDGRAIAASVSFAPVGTASSDAARNLQIGYTTNADLPFEGTLDDVRVYNRILSADEVTNLYNRSGAGIKINTTATTTGATGLVGHWTFDGPDLTTATATDKSGRGNNGVLTSGPSPIIGKIGQGLSFDGVNDYIDLGINGATPDLDLTTDLTISAWVKLNSDYSTIQVIAARYDPTSSRTIYWLEYGRTDNKFSFFNGTAQLDSSVSVSDNDWHHVAVTRTGTTGDWTITFYIDNVAYAQQTATNPQTDLDENTAIGKAPDLNTGFFNGRIDDVRIYNRALTADEIADLYTGTTGSVAGICGTGGVRDADGNSYGIVQIGTQCWLDRNMNVGSRINAASGQTDNGTTEKYCYNDTASNCTDNHPKRPDGGLYQWDEAMQYSTTEGARGICPSGWHIPTDAEWYTLENYLKDAGQSCGAGRSGLGCSPAGTKIKPNGTSLWEGNFAGGASGGSFFNLSGTATFWSTTVSGADVWTRQLFLGSAQVLRGLEGKTYAYSVRCIKD